MFKWSKEIIVYLLKKKTTNFFLFLSVSQGWGLFKIKPKKMFVQSNLYNSDWIFKLLPAYKLLLENFTLGLYRYFTMYIKLQGMGYKSVISRSILLLKLGYSHRILVKIPQDIRLIYLSRSILLFKGRTLNKIKNLIYNIQQLRKANAYKKKGLFLKGSIIKIKESSKKSKF